VSPFETILACTIILAAIIQIAILLSVRRSVNRFTTRADRLFDSVEPQIRKVTDGVESLQGSLQSASDHVTATLASVRATADALTDLVEVEAREIADLVHKTTSMAERQAEEAERLLDQARNRIAELGTEFDEKVVDPVRGVLAVAVGIRRGVEALTARRSSGEVPEETSTDGRSS
jgi:F0F1-type ATP synthase membrane subunit b/b'